MKTTTLGYQDNPTHSICKGHVDLKTFNDAFHNEGWSGDDDGFDPELVTHEYWVHQGKTWTKADKDTPGAEPVTVGAW